jgi:tRNA(fMet)-specific endonuclease VapC
MITHLVDSDWLVDYLKGKGEALALLSPLIEQGSLATTIINYAEISEGLLEAEAATPYLQALSRFLEGVPLVGLDVLTAETFAGLRADLRRRGRLIPDHDLWIASAALRNDLTLISRDHAFERIPDLKRYQQG